MTITSSKSQDFILPINHIRNNRLMIKIYNGDAQASDPDNR